MLKVIVNSPVQVATANMGSIKVMQDRWKETQASSQSIEKSEFDKSVGDIILGAMNKIRDQIVTSDPNYVIKEAGKQSGFSVGNMYSNIAGVSAGVAVTASRFPVPNKYSKSVSYGATIITTIAAGAAYANKDNYWGGSNQLTISPWRATN
jgi:hypothetical protein